MARQQYNRARNPRANYVYRAPVRHRKQKRGGPPLWLIVLLCVLALAVVAVALGFLLREKPEPDSSVPISISVVVPSYDVLLPATEAEEEPVQDEPEPEHKEPIELSFTAEELERLDNMLTEWAVAVTAPVGEEAEGDVGQQAEADGQEEVMDGETSSPTTLTPENYGHNVSVFFMDLDSGLTYLYNEGKSYLIASLNKAPYAMYLYTLAEQGTLDLEDTIYVTVEMLEASAENSGRLKDDESLPRSLTIEELIYEMLRYSDTGALRILLQYYPATGYVTYTETLNLPHPENVRSVTNGRITPEDAGAYLVALHSYMENGEYGERLKEHLTNTRNLMIRSNHMVARKYGWDVESLHDMAVVYADHPYLLAILTDKSYGTWAEQAMFTTIAATFEEIMEEKWAVAESFR